MLPLSPPDQPPPPNRPDLLPLPPGPATSAGTVAAQTLGAMCLGVALGAVAGGVSGFIFFQALGSDSSETWETLGALLLAALGALFVGAMTYAGVAITAIVRWVEAGRRAWPIAAVFGVPTLVVVVPGVLSAGFG